MRRTVNLRYHKIFIISFIVMAASYFADISFAEGEKTQLDMNKEVYDENNKADKDFRKVDFVGNALLKPVDVVKTGTEDKLLFNRASFAHEEVDVNQPDQRGMFFQRKSGPKISLNF